MGVDADASLQTVIQIASQVREYMPIFARAPALKAIGLEGSYKILADFGDAVLAGRLGKKGANFVTWEWDFDRNGVHMGHYFIENMKVALKKLHELGVSTWAVIHCPEIGCGMDADGNYHEFKSLKLPKGYIKGTVGAGDAFCAGVLYAAERGKTCLLYTSPSPRD